MADRLASLARMRRQDVDEARRNLAGCLDLEAAAERCAAASDASIAREMQAAGNLSAGDHAAANFAAWLETARASAATARLEQQRTGAATGRARAALVAARAAAEAVEMLRAAQAASRHAAALRAEQHDLDEIGRRSTAADRSRR
jgi:flagellar export protein FliJ